MSEKLALIVDVADSRGIDDFPTRRDRVLAELSRLHRENGWIERDYAVTAWDEFQGLADAPLRLPDLAWSFWKAFQPWSLRLALAIGEVETVPGSPGDAPLNRAVTGEAFFHARAALEALDSPPQGASRVRLRVGPDDDRRARLANAVMRLVDALVQDITERQWQVITLYERGGKQSEVARELSVSESTISRTLASARYWELKASLAELSGLLAGSDESFGGSEGGRP